MKNEYYVPSLEKLMNLYGNDEISDIRWVVRKDDIVVSIQRVDAHITTRVCLITALKSGELKCPFTPQAGAQIYLSWGRDNDDSNVCICNHESHVCTEHYYLNLNEDIIAYSILCNTSYSDEFNEFRLNTGSDDFDDFLKWLGSASSRRNKDTNGTLSSLLSKAEGGK